MATSGGAGGAGAAGSGAQSSFCASTEIVVRTQSSPVVSRQRARSGLVLMAGIERNDEACDAQCGLRAVAPTANVYKSACGHVWVAARGVRSCPAAAQAHGMHLCQLTSASFKRFRSLTRQERERERACERESERERERARESERERERESERERAVKTVFVQDRTEQHKAMTELQKQADHDKERR
jgi:hypothetical protein